MFRVLVKLSVGFIVAAVVSLGLLQGLEYSGYPAMSTFEDLLKSFDDEECQEECGSFKQ